MDSKYTVYARKQDESKWHWRKDCPDFPTSQYVSMLSTGTIQENELCPKCIELNLLSFNAQLQTKRRDKNSD